MTFSLGRDMGIVMAKGVVIGVFCCVTLLPALVLTFDKAIEKTTHKPLLPSFDKASAFITKHYKNMADHFPGNALPGNPWK